MTAAFICVGVAGLVLSGAALATSGVQAMVSAAAGAAFALVNLWALSGLVRAYLYSNGASWVIVGTLKMLLLFGGIFLLADRGFVDVVPLIIGYLALPVGIALTHLKPAPAPTAEGR